MKTIDVRHLAEWEVALKEELEELQKQRSSLEREIQKVGRKLELLRQMRSLEGGQLDKITPGAQIGEGRPTPSSVKDFARKVLSEAGRPMHISEIHGSFVERGYPIPGGGTPFNILAHMVNDKGFVRVARGTYALTGTVPADQILPKVRRKRRSRRKKKVRKNGEGTGHGL